MNYAQLFNHIKNDGCSWKSVERDKHSVQYSIEVDDKTKVIRLLFQESSDKIDWRDNFKFPSKVYKNQTSPILAHSGFAEAYKSANDIIMEELINKISSSSGFKVVITGWSHGGALAQLAAEDLNYRTRALSTDPNTGVKPIVVTFGSPKVFKNKASVEYVRDCCESVTEVAQHNDIVSRVFWLHKHLATNKKLGEKYCIFKVINPFKYHTEYDKEELYAGKEFDKSGIIYTEKL